MKIKLLILTILIGLILFNSCRQNSIQTIDEINTEGKHETNNVAFKEVLNATKLNTENEVLSKVPNFSDDYISSDFVLDTTKIKKTIKNGVITEYAIYLKKKNNTEKETFYNLVFSKKKNIWTKHLFKLTPNYLNKNFGKSTQIVNYKISLLSKSNETSRCHTEFYSYEYFQCASGHTNPYDGDCGGCWHTIATGLGSTCDESAPGDWDVSGGGENGGGGSQPLTLDQIGEIIKNLTSSATYSKYTSLPFSFKQGVIACLYNDYLANDLLEFVINFLYNNPDTQNPDLIYYRIKDIIDLSSSNPNALLEIPCSELPKWQTLANHAIPQMTKDRISQINSQAGLFDSASLQSIYTANGPSLNMDLFQVKITTLPNKPGTNQQYTPSEFFQYFRKNISNFVTGTTFTPVIDSSYNIDDTDLWNSNNPLGSLIHITIPGNAGTVICTDYSSEEWIFTTVDIPWDDQHPVSGNRRFGYYMVGNTMYIYTRGVDRFTFNLYNYTISWFAEGIGFNKADELWTSFQTKVSAYVNTTGQANAIQPVIYRPSWIKIRNYIKGTSQLNSLGCH